MITPYSFALLNVDVLLYSFFVVGVGLTRMEESDWERCHGSTVVSATELD